MECNISKDDLKIVLLKCVGSKYPTRIVCANHELKAGFIRGFYDAECNFVLVSEREDLLDSSKVDLKTIIRIETVKVITYERSRSRIFNVN
jgi:hypothetical protein